MGDSGTEPGPVALCPRRPNKTPASRASTQCTQQRAPGGRRRYRPPHKQASGAVVSPPQSSRAGVVSARRSRRRRSASDAWWAAAGAAAAAAAAAGGTEPPPELRNSSADWLTSSETAAARGPVAVRRAQFTRHAERTAAPRGWGASGETAPEIHAALSQKPYRLALDDIHQSVNHIDKSQYIGYVNNLHEI